MSVRAILDSPVADVMHRGVVSCRTETPLSAVARMMAAHRIHCVVVRDDEQGDLWGVVSDLDVVAAAASEGLVDRTAGGISVTPALSITPRDTLRRAAELMARRAVSHLVVVDPRSSRLVGVLSSLDVARVLADQP